MKKNILLLSITIISVCAMAQPFVGLYTFDSVKTTSGIVDPSFVPTATGVTFGSFSATGTPPNPAAGTIGRFNFSGWSNGSMNGDSLYSQMTGMVQDTEYYEVTVTPAFNYTLSFDSIRFRFGRSTTGVRSYAVRSSADGYTTNLTAAIVPANVNLTVESGNEFFLNNDYPNLTFQAGSAILLSGASFTNVSTPITFRFYAWNSEAPTGTFSIDNVRIVGSALMGVGIKENSNEGISVYPNPSANGVFTVDLGNSTGRTIVSVNDIIGNLVMTKEINSSTKQTIDLSNMANGCYFITVKNNTNLITKKLTVNK